MPGSLFTKVTRSCRRYGLLFRALGPIEADAHQEKLAVRQLPDLSRRRLLGPLALLFPQTQCGFPAALGDRRCLLPRPLPTLRLRQIPYPQRDRTLGAPQLHLDLVVRPALEPQFPRPVPQVVLRVRALRPFRRRLALQEAVEDVVVVDVQSVADLASAESLAPQPHRPLPQPLEVRVLAMRMCHTHTVRPESDLPGSNGERFSSSRDFRRNRRRSITECGVGQASKLTGKGAPGARRLEA